MNTGALRPLEPRDADVAAHLVDSALASTPYRDRAREILAAALRGDPEWRMHGSFAVSVQALAAFGPVSGAQAVWRVGFLVFSADSSRRDVADALIASVVSVVSAAGARMLVAEQAADEAIGFSLSVLRANGFRQEARIPDFYREGVAQLFLRRDLTRASGS